MDTLFHAIDNFARITPAKPSIVLNRKGEWRQFSYSDLHDETQRWARLWLQHCKCPGAVVFLILRHGIEMYPAFLGAMRAGLTPSFLPYPTQKQDPLLYWRAHTALFARVEPACILSYAELVPTLRNLTDSTSCSVLDIETVSASDINGPLPDAPDPQRVALLQHSSGTTGLKKGVALNYEQIRAQLQSYAAAIKGTRHDIIVSWLPVYHDMGLIAAFLLPLCLGATLISLDAFEWLTRPDMLFDEICRFRGTLCWLPNFAFNHLVRTRDRDKTYNLSSMRAFINCSEPCKPETMEAFQTTFAHFGLKIGALQSSYALAENVFAVTQSRLGSEPRILNVDRELFNRLSYLRLVDSSHIDTLRFFSCGRVVDDVAVRIVPKPTDGIANAGPASSPAGDLVIGEIQVHSPFLFQGYFRNPSSTEAAFDGIWLRTGDMGFLHEGDLYVCGRIKEMLIIHGRNYYANDIEDVVNQVEGIKPGRVVAVGVYDPVTATEEAVVMAETILPDGESRAALGHAIRMQVFDSLSLSLRRIEIADEGTLIKTTSGKLSREENVKRIGMGVFA